MIQPPDNTHDEFGSIPIAGEEAPSESKLGGPAPPQPPSTPMSRKKRKRRSFPWITLFIASPMLAFAVYLLIGFFLIPYLATTKFAEELSEDVGRSVTIADANFNPFTLSLTLFNGIVGAKLNDPQDQVDPVLSFSRLTVDFEALGLVKRAIILQKLEADQFFLHVVRFQDGSYNIIKMMRPQDEEEGGGLNLLLPARFSLNNISLVDSRLVFDDKPSGKVHTVEEIDLALPALSNFTYKTKQYINPKFSAKINGSPIEMTGETTVESGALSARLDLHLKKLDLPSYLAYLPIDFNFTLTNGQADLDLGLVYTTAPSAASQLQIEGTGTLSDIWIKDGEGNTSRIPKAKIAGSVSPLSNHFNLQELVLTNPEIKIDKSPTGRWSFTGSKKSSTRKNAGSEKTTPAAIKIDRFQVTDGKISIIDRQIEGGFSETLSDFQLSITSFNNKDGQKAPFALSAKSAQNMRISAQGSIYPSPVKAEGLLVIDQLDLTRLTPYFAMRRDLGIHTGLANKISARFVLEKNKKSDDPAFRFDDMEMQLKNLTLAQKNEEWLRLPDLTVKAASVASTSRTINFGDVTGANGYLLLSWDEKGLLNWQEHNQSTSSAKDKDWDTTFKSLEFTGATVALKVEDPAGPLEMELNKVDIRTDITDQKAQEGNIKGTAQTNGAGSLQFAGPITVKPFKVELACTANNVPLSEVRTLINSWFTPTVKGGVMQANGTLKLPEFEFAGSVGVQSFSAASQQTPGLVRWQNAIAHDMDLKLKPFSLKIASINVEKPFLDWTLFEKNRSSLSKMFRNDEGSSVNSDISRIDIAEIRLSDGELDFTDKIVSPPYSTTVQAISGSITDIKDQSGGKTRFKLQGMVSGSSPISLNGDFGFFDTHLFADFTGQLTEMPITPLMPYIEPLIGYQIRKGLLTIHTTYKQQDQKITADNGVTVQGFELGQRTDGNAQLPLTIALHMDASKTVSLDIPIRGDISEADFSFKNSFVKVVRNLLIKTAVSPFALLASLAPEQEHPLNRLIFPYGATSLTESNEKQLTLLADILKKRPYLIVQINGYADTVCDREAIAAKHHQEEALRRLEREARLSTQLSKTYGKEEIVTPEIPGPSASGGSAEHSTLPEKAIMEALNELADQRSKLIRQHLVDELGIPPERVQTGKSRIQSSEEPPKQCASRVDFTLDTLLK